MCIIKIAKKEKAMKNVVLTTISALLLFILSALPTMAEEMCFDRKEDTLTTPILAEVNGEKLLVVTETLSEAVQIAINNAACVRPYGIEVRSNKVIESPRLMVGFSVWVNMTPDEYNAPSYWKPYTAE